MNLHTNLDLTYFQTKDLYNNKKRLFSRCFHDFNDKNHVKRPTK